MVETSSPLSYVAGRLAWGLVVIWATLTVCFVILWTLPATRMVYFSPVEMGIAATGIETGNVLSAYVRWLEAFLTLEWHRSVYYEKPVVQLYMTRIPVTLTYLVPGVLVSTVFGTLFTTYAATERRSPLHHLLSAAAILALSVPAFVLAFVFYMLMPKIDWIYVYNPNIPLTAPANLLHLLVPSAIVGLAFFGVQVRHAQTETIDLLGEPFIKTARAKGAGRLRIARHVFRNAWPSMASLVQGEALGILLLSTIVVEWHLRIPGIAVAVYNGFAAGDPMLTFSAVFGIVLLGVVATIARDVARVALDPQYR